MIRLICLLLALIAVLTLASCGEKQAVNYSITETVEKSYTPPERR